MTRPRLSVYVVLLHPRAPLVTYKRHPQRASAKKRKPHEAALCLSSDASVPPVRGCCIFRGYGPDTTAVAVASNCPAQLNSTPASFLIIVLCRVHPLMQQQQLNYPTPVARNTVSPALLLLLLLACAAFAAAASAASPFPSERFRSMTPFFRW